MPAHDALCSSRIRRPHGDSYVEWACEREAGHEGKHIGSNPGVPGPQYDEWKDYEAAESMEDPDD